MGANDISCFSTVRGSVDAVKFTQFLEDNVVPVLQPYNGINRNSVLVMGEYATTEDVTTNFTLETMQDGVRQTSFFFFFLFGILDNAAIHHVTEVRDIIQGTGVLLIYLPPYSPDFNPLEEVFSKVKGRIRQNNIVFQATDYSEATIIESFYHVTSEDCNGYFRHARYLE